MKKELLKQVEELVNEMTEYQIQRSNLEAHFRKQIDEIKAKELTARMKASALLTILNRQEETKGVSE